MIDRRGLAQASNLYVSQQEWCPSATLRARDLVFTIFLRTSKKLYVSFRSLNSRPYVVSLLGLVILVSLVKPWGDYPINDDWVYAGAARSFAATSSIHIDATAAANTVGQSLLAFPVLKLFGFSHTILRLHTLVLATLLLWLIHRLLHYGDVDVRLQSLVLLVFIFNPIFAHLAMSFMTEVYGFTVAFLAAVIWFRGRFHDSAPTDVPLYEKPLISWAACLVTAVLSGATFWIRQSCIIVFPALVVATLARSCQNREWLRLQKSSLRLSFAMVLFVAVVLSYFLWERASDNINLYNSVALTESLWALRLRDILKNSLLCLVYLTAFLMPVLIWMPWTFRARYKLFVTAVLVALGMSCALMAQLYVSPGNDPKNALHQVFPFAGNLIFNAGVGPITLTDTYIHNLPNRPRWPDTTWWIVQWLIIAAQSVWAPVLLGTPSRLQRSSRRLPAEVLLFSVVFALGSLLFTIQMCKWRVYDRYYFPVILGIGIAAAIVIAQGRTAMMRPKSGQLWRAFASI